MKASIITVLVAGLALQGCYAYSTINEVTLSNGMKIDVVRHRSDVRFADCGTMNVTQTWLDGKLIDSKDARGNALHCDLTVEAFRAGGTLGGAALIANGAARAAKAAANASNTLEINNANTNNAEGYYSGVQNLNQSQSQSMTGGVTTTTTTTNTNTPPATSHGHGNNGFGNGGNDGSPNGKSDNGR